MAAQHRRRPRADLPVRHPGDRPALDADAAAARGHGQLSRGARSTPIYWPHEPVEMAGKKVAIIGTGATAIQVIGEIADKVGELTVFQRRPNWSAPLNNGPISDEEMADIRARYDEIFATCARTPGGFEHEPDRRGFYEVSARGAAGAVGQALRRARLRHLAEQFPRDLHRRGGQRRVLRLHRRPHPPARQGSGDRREADPQGSRLRRAAGAAGDAATSRPTTATTSTSSTSARRRSSGSPRRACAPASATTNSTSSSTRPASTPSRARSTAIDISGVGGAETVRQVARRPVDLPRHAGPRLPESADADRPAERLGVDELSARHRDGVNWCTDLLEHMWDRGYTAPSRRRRRRSAGPRT